jgi:hypothetical protein
VRTLLRKENTGRCSVSRWGSFDSKRIDPAISRTKRKLLGTQRRHREDIIIPSYPKSECLRCRVHRSEQIPQPFRRDLSIRQSHLSTRRAVNEATRPRRGMSGRDEAGRGATRQAGIVRALPTGWSGRDEVGRGPPGPCLVPGPAPRSQLYPPAQHLRNFGAASDEVAKRSSRKCRGRHSVHSQLKSESMCLQATQNRSPIAERVEGQALPHSKTAEACATATPGLLSALPSKCCKLSMFVLHG